jgi:hypothetical protein
LDCSQIQPLERLSCAGRHTLTEQVPQPEVILAFGVSLRCRLLIPTGSFGVVSGNTIAIGISHGKQELSARIACLGQLSLQPQVCADGALFSCFGLLWALRGEASAGVMVTPTMASAIHAAKKR